jgi:hypothetical protein
MKIRTLIAATLAGFSIIGASPSAFAADSTARETITPAFAEAIANVPGKTMTALVVDYAPGGKSPSHRHGQAFVVGYVLSGAIRSRVNNGEERPASITRSAKTRARPNRRNCSPSSWRIRKTKTSSRSTRSDGVAAALVAAHASRRPARLRRRSRLPAFFR